MSSDSSEGKHGGLMSRRSLGALSVTAAAAATALTIPGARAQTSTPNPSATGRLDRILSSGKLRVGQYLQFKPYGFKRPDGTPDGFDVELTKMLAADMGVTPEYIDSSWEGIIPGLLSDKFDLITANLAITLKRSLVVQYCNPHSFTSSAFIVREADAGKFTSLDAFNDPSIRISVLIQDAAHAILARFFPKAQVVDFNTADDGLLALMTNKVGASIGEISYLTQFTKEHPGLKVVSINIPGTSVPAGMAMRPGEDNMHFLSFVNTWVQFYYWTGAFEPLWKKWTPWNPIPKVDKFMAPV